MVIDLRKFNKNSSKRIRSAVKSKETRPCTQLDKFKLKMDDNTNRKHKKDVNFRRK